MDKKRPKTGYSIRRLPCLPTAIQCHHYLSQAERKIAVKKCFNVLKESGIFFTFENICYKNNNADLIAVKHWQNYMLSNGKTPHEVKKNSERRGTEVFPITIDEHIELLENSDFKCVELLWLSYMQAGFIAIK